MDLVAELGGEPLLKNGFVICRTICHGGDSHKLYYYPSTQLFHCYTECAGDSFDIFDLVRKVMKTTQNEDWNLNRAINFVIRYFGIIVKDEEFGEENQKLQDWQILKNYHQEKQEDDNKRIIEFKNFDENILRYFPRPRIEPWINEGISQEVMDLRGICYDPVSQGIVIPHYDENGALIGIRERTLIKEEEVYGKYRPAVINGEIYNHPLGFALYNLNNSKDNIARMGLAIVTEGEKGALQYASKFGVDNDISVATCGSNLIQHQVDLLIRYGAKEIVIAFDRQWQEKNDEEFKRWTKKLTAFHKKYSKLVNISFIFDKEGTRLGYKESPLDVSKETFLELFKERIRL